MIDPVLAATRWPTNAYLFADVRKLGYLDDYSLTLDATYGKGNFWTIWKPARLIANDTHRIAMLESDFTNLPFADETFDRVVFDPPYKLNGTPSPSDYPYGVEHYTRWQDRIELMRLGQAECARVVKKRGLLLTKCMDQVVSGKVRWQTDHMTRVAFDNGMDKVDRFDFLVDPREQPHDRQCHASRNYSSLLVFKKRR